MKAARFAVAIALLAAAAGWPFAVRAPYVTHVGVLVFISMTLALSLNLMLRLGQLTLAQGAFFGLGAYASALLTKQLGVPFPIAFLAAGLAAAVPALVFGPIFLRIKGVYFALLTFALGQLVNLVFQEWVSLFGGNNGLLGIPKPVVFGFRISAPRDFYLLAFAVAAATFFALRALYASRIGDVIAALDENEPLGQAVGLNALAWRTALFGVSSFFSGLAGSIYAHYLGIISPEAFTFWVVVDAIAMNVVGGAAYLSGAVVGALLLVPLPEILRDTAQYARLIFGLVVMGSLIFLPRGIMGKVAELRSSRRSVRTSAAARVSGELPHASHP